MAKYIAVMLICLAFVPMATVASAKDIILHAGDSYSINGDNIVCLPGKATTPLIIKDCQEWEEFGEVCLYERQVLSIAGKECEIKCQYWDDFNKVCKYETSCRYLPAHDTFISTTCIDFDSFNNKCRREKEEQIGKK